MNACVSITVLFQRSQLLFAVLAVSFFAAQRVAHSAPVVVGADHRVTSAYSGIQFEALKGNYSTKAHLPTLLKPHAIPSALPADSGRKTVNFSVRLIGEAQSPAKVYLRRIGDKKIIPMNDLGKDGDVSAGDGIRGVDVKIDTAKVKPDSCLRYEAFIKHGRAELVSPPLQLCVSSFPVTLAEPDVSSPAKFPDGSMAVADEILITVTPATTAAAIRQLARSIGANVAGSDLPLNLYQLKLASPASTSQLLEIAAQLRGRAGVVTASINALGQFVQNVNDTAFNLPQADINSQHGLKLALAHNQATGANAWDVSTKAQGDGVTVIVLDSGLDRTHPEFGGGGYCQLADNNCSSSNDNDGHGTQVAGVIAARANNSQGVAGIAFDSKIYPIQVSTTTTVAHTQMVAGFNAARDYVALHPEASVVNASFAAGGASATAAQWTAVCGAIEQVVSNTGVPRAVVVSAAGNNNLNAAVYPARCNDLNAALVHRELLITVSNSVSLPTPDCQTGGVQNPKDTRCNGNAAGNPVIGGSNYGAWVDIAAPGAAIRTTTKGGGYVTVTGTSFSAPMVAGAAAILRSCGMAPELIESTLRTSANKTVSYPAFNGIPGGSTPRLDINNALRAYAPTATNMSTAQSYTEDTPLNLADIVVTDLDGCATITATLTLSAGAGTLSVDTSGTVASTYNPSTRVWRASGPRDDVNALLAGVTFTPVSSYSGNFSIATWVSDGIAPAITGTKAMTGIPVNDAPTLTLTPATASTPENGGTIKVADIAVSDDALGTNSLAVSDTAAFQIVGSELHFKGNADYETKSSYSVTVSVDDATLNGTTPEASQVFTLSITDVNEAPALTLTPASASVPENGGSTKVADIAISDDALGTNSLAVSDTAFQIVGSELHFKGNADYETKNSYSVTVSVDDATINGATPEASQAFTLSISDVNEAPALTLTPATASTPENGGSIKVADIAVSDDGLGTTSMAVSDTAAFQIVGSELHFKGNADYETKNSYSVTVSVDDSTINGATPEASQVFTLSVTDVNEAPTLTLTPAAASVPENGGSTKVADIAVSDDALGTNSLAVSDTAAFQIVGSELHFKGNADYETKSSYSVTVSVDDATINGATPEASQVFTLSVTDVNEAPTLTLTPASASVPENGGTIKVADIAISDDALGTNSLAVSDPAAFQIVGSELHFKGNADYETKSSYSVTVSVDDSTINGTTPEASQVFTLSITDVNDAPTLTLTPATASTPENGGTIKVADIAVSDDALGTNSLAVSDAAFQIVGSELHFKGNADYETKNSYSVTVSVDDSTINGATPEASQNFTLSITDVNEAIPAPVLIYDHKEIGTDAFGNTVARYRFRVGNWNAYPPAMFVASPALPPCGLNTSASRTWVDFYRASDNSRIYGFCALGSPADLNQIWFGVIPANGIPPASVYITLTDRQNNIVYKSNVVTIP